MTYVAAIGWRVLGRLFDTHSRNIIAFDETQHTYKIIETKM